MPLLSIELRIKKYWVKFLAHELFGLLSLEGYYQRPLLFVKRDRERSLLFIEYSGIRTKSLGPLILDLYSPIMVPMNGTL